MKERCEDERGLSRLGEEFVEPRSGLHEALPHQQKTREKILLEAEHDGWRRLL